MINNRTVVVVELNCGGDIGGDGGVGGGGGSGGGVVVEEEVIREVLVLVEVALFISYLSASKLAPSTISSYIFAISYAHKLKSYPDPTKSFFTRKLLSAQSRRGSPDVRLPITRPVLYEVISSLSHTTGSAYQRTLYTAMFPIAFNVFFLRDQGAVC